jgi:16S rRNA (cytidine1402-2'-O)-methyltransferase
MAGTLYVVATPIGHLDDITLRALRVLREVSLVAAEDTRRTVNLLRHYEIRTPLISVHEHNEQSRAPQLVGRLLAGESMALVSDAGTPAVSDPGAVLVEAARREGIRVEAVPGPSAVMAALSIAGIRGDEFSFLGFPPTRPKARKSWIKRLEHRADTNVVFFESPHRIASTLLEISNWVNQPILVCRELTKVHEEVLSGPPAELAARFAVPKGEFTVVIPARTGLEAKVSQDDTDKIGLLTKIKASRSKREAARIVAEELNLPTKQVYEALDRADSKSGGE